MAMKDSNILITNINKLAMKKVLLDYKLNK